MSGADTMRGWVDDWVTLQERLSDRAKRLVVNPELWIWVDRVEADCSDDLNEYIIAARLIKEVWWTWKMVDLWDCRPHTNWDECYFWDVADHLLIASAWIMRKNWILPDDAAMYIARMLDTQQYPFWYERKRPIWWPRSEDLVRDIIVKLWVILRWNNISFPWVWEIDELDLISSLPAIVVASTSRKLLSWDSVWVEWTCAWYLYNIWTEDLLARLSSNQCNEKYEQGGISIKEKIWQLSERFDRLKVNGNLSSYLGDLQLPILKEYGSIQTSTLLLTSDEPEFLRIVLRCLEAQIYLIEQKWEKIIENWKRRTEDRILVIMWLWWDIDSLWTDLQGRITGIQDYPEEYERFIRENDVLAGIYLWEIEKLKEIKKGWLEGLDKYKWKLGKEIDSFRLPESLAIDDEESIDDIYLKNMRTARDEWVALKARFDEMKGKFPTTEAEALEKRDNFLKLKRDIDFYLNWFTQWTFSDIEQNFAEKREQNEKLKDLEWIKNVWKAKISEAKSKDDIEDYLHWREWSRERWWVFYFERFKFKRV